MTPRTIEVFTLEDVTHLRVDAPGERAVSAPITDPVALIRQIAEKCGLEVDEAPGELYISLPLD